MKNMNNDEIRTAVRKNYGKVASSSNATGCCNPSSDSASEGCCETSEVEKVSLQKKLQKILVIQMKKSTVFQLSLI
jgi:hypothetical protein